MTTIRSPGEVLTEMLINYIIRYDSEPFSIEILRFSCLGGRVIDEIDIELIRQLQKDCRARHVDIAKRLNVVEGTVRKRIRALLENNIIKNIAAPNISKLGYNFIGFMALQVQVAKLRKIADILGKKPNVCYLAFVTGRYDMIAIVITRSPQEFAQLIEKEMSLIPGVVRLETFVNLETLKGGWPIVDTTQLLNSVDVSELKGP